MKRSFKTEIKFNNEQKRKFHQSVGVCRWLYNQYIAKNKERYQLYSDGRIEKKDSFIPAYAFDKYINELKELEEYQWISNCGSKARKKAILNAESAFKLFFRGRTKFPRFKKKKNKDVTLYFPKNGKFDWKTDRHRIKIPTLGWVRLKEFGYIPTKSKAISGMVSQKGDRYYVSVLVETESYINKRKRTESIGIDLGLKDFAIVSNGEVYKNINKSQRIRKIEKQLKREQRVLSRKLEKAKTKPEGRATGQNIQKQVLKVQKIHQKLANIRTDYINKTIASFIERNPSSITIEDLNVQGMMKNRHLSKSVAQQKFYEFRLKLMMKCKMNNIELRLVDRWYPSSRLCSCCGFYKNDLKLSDRIFECSDCTTSIDRDLNASINLKNAKEYKIA